MNASRYEVPTAPRFIAFVFALTASFTVLGSTVFGMQPNYDGSAPQVMALETVTVTANRVN